MLRRLGLVLVGVLLATVLSGCSPPPSNQVAIRVVDGAAEFVFAPCPGKRVHDVILAEENVVDRRIWHASGGPDAPMTTVRLFQIPDGWLPGNNTLTELRADIEALDEGQVLGPGKT